MKRPLNPLGTIVNFFYQWVTRASVVPNTMEDRRGLANRVFAGLAPLLARSAALKSTNRSLYVVVKWSANFLLLLSLLGIASGLVQLFARLL